MCPDNIAECTDKIVLKKMEKSYIFIEVIDINGDTIFSSRNYS